MKLYNIDSSGKAEPIAEIGEDLSVLPSTEWLEEYIEDLKARFGGDTAVVKERLLRSLNNGYSVLV